MNNFQNYTLPKPSPPSQEILDYWESVRQGIAVHEAHEFGDIPEQAIGARREKIQRLIAAAARLAREIEGIATKQARKA